ncbi:uncharacterized protein LOC110681324 [Aedes aegypti]|uniref:Uncharacterized protein n=1 Tax=Aedes aegypti TaxID=7159 RepID=A0A903VM08_AEDAE|nr:uncharacterized protein LOC110681324 [Aedes aegypti]
MASLHPKWKISSTAYREFANGQSSAADAPDAFGLRNLTYIQLTSEDELPKDLHKQLNYRRLKHQCDQRHAQMRNLAHGLQSSDPQEQQTAGETLQRHKRAIADWFYRQTPSGAARDTQPNVTISWEARPGRTCAAGSMTTVN